MLKVISYYKISVINIVNYKHLRYKFLQDIEVGPEALIPAMVALVARPSLVCLQIMVKGEDISKLENKGEGLVIVSELDIPVF